MAVAAAWKLPIVFMIQNNQYGMGTAKSKSTPVADLSLRAAGYGFPGASVDGNDITAVYEVVTEYVDRARNGGGPGLIVAETYRLYGHQVGDTQIYRPKGESEEWWKKDPLPRYQKKLMDMGILTGEMVDKIDADARAEIEEASKLAMAAPFISYEDHIKTALDVL